MDSKTKVKESIELFWQTKKIKAQIEIVFQKETFLPKATANLEELKEKLKVEEDALAKIEDSHKREDRDKRKEIEEKIQNLNKGLKAQEKEIQRSNQIIEQAPWVIQEADIYLEIIKNL